MIENRRKPKSEITAQHEDAGLFKRDVVRMPAQLIPRMWRNRRQDLLIARFVNGDTPIELLFAGRRKDTGLQVAKILEELWTRVNRAAESNDRTPEVEDVRLAVWIDGSWRLRYETDQQGWQTRHYQLIVARWAVREDQKAKPERVLLPTE